MKLRTLLPTATALLILVSCDDSSPTSSQSGDMGDSATYTDITAESVQDMVIGKQFTKIFDVSPYYDNGHLPYSIDANGVSGVAVMVSSLDKDGTYLVYCHADGPSIAGAKALAAAGFTNVYRLEGNFSAWDAVSFLDISAEQVKMKIDSDQFAAIYDVSPHYSTSHIPGATDAYGTLATLIADDDVMKEYLVYCHGDAPSMAGAQAMEDAGFTKTYRLEGNFGAWTAAEYPTE